MPKYFITLSRSFTVETKGTEREAIKTAFADLVEGLTTGEIREDQFEVDIWEED